MTVQTAEDWSGPGVRVTDRRSLLLLALPALAASMWLLMPMVRAAGYASRWEQGLLLALGLALLASWAALAAGRLREPLAAGLALGLSGFGFGERLLMSFLSGQFADPASGHFTPLFAMFPVYYGLLLFLLPYPRSRSAVLLAWLAFVGTVTALSAPLWWPGAPAGSTTLVSTLVYLWVGHGLFIALLFAWARQRVAQMARDEQAIRERSLGEARFRLVFEQATAGIGLIDGDARWIDVNARLAGLLGYQPEELRGHQVCELLPEAGRAALRERMRAFLGSGEGPDEYHVEGPWQHRDGHPVWLARDIKRVDGAAGMAARAVLMATDIGPRVRAEAELAERHRHEEFQFSTLPLALIEWERDLRVRRWSPQAERMLGWPAEAVVGRTLREAGLLSAAESDHHEAIMGEFLRGERRTIESLRRSRRRDGSEAWFRWYSRSLPGADGQPEFFFTAGIDVTELVEANARLDENERRLRTILDTAAVGIALLDAQGRWLDVNPRVCDITGYTREELLARDFQSITHPDDLEADVAQAEALVRGERQQYSFEKRYIRKDGSQVWIRLHVSRLAETASVPMRFVSIIEDISDRKQAERYAEESRRIRDFHVDHTPLAVIEWTPDFSVRAWSRRAEEMFGWKSEEVLGRALRDWRFVYEADAGHAAEVMAQLQSGVATVKSVNRNYHADGRVLWCEWHNSALRAPDGSVQAYYSLIHDVTEEQFALAALRDSQARFRSIFEQAAVGIAIIDAESHWLMVNQRLCELVGYRTEDLLRRTCLEITQPEDCLTELALRRQLVAGEISDYRIEKRYRRADGSLVWAQVFARRLEVGHGEPVRLSLIVEDIGERKHAEARLAELHANLERQVADRTSQLQQTTHRWAQRSRELGLLAEMMGVLPAARDAREANVIVSRYVPKLFQRLGGEIWIEEEVPDRYLRIASWNIATPGPASIGTDDCWALRRAQPLQVEDPDHPLACPHCGPAGAQQEPHVCVPIMALGDVVGLIHLRWSERAGAEALPPDRMLLTSAAEQIGLAIGNVRLREELRRQALRDPLTGLYNRRHFEDCLAQRVAEHRRTGRTFGLVMVDVDHFKAVNDRYGHDAGDEVLRAIGGLLQREVRSDEAAFRLGGEEFVMLVNDRDGHDVAGCTERLRQAIEQCRHAFAGKALPVITASLGAARFPADASEGAVLVNRADQALYAAKRTGRNRVCFASALPDRQPELGSVALAPGRLSRD